MASGFKINRQGVQQFTRELEREFAKHPVCIPVEADPSGLAPAMTVNNYHRPVVTVNGDQAQPGWESTGSTSQTQHRVEQIAPGYEELARTLTDLLANLPAFAFGEDEDEAKNAVQAVLSEVTKPQPDQSSIKRGLTMIKGLLAPIATRVSAAVTTESSDAARHLIEALGNTLPF